MLIWLEIQKLKIQQKKGLGDADFEKMFGKDIDEFLENSDWDIESFENMSNFSRGTARSAFLDGRLRGLENIYLQRIESSLKRGGVGAGKGSKKAAAGKPKFRALQDRFIDNPSVLMANEGDAKVFDVSSNHSQSRISRIGRTPLGAPVGAGL